MLNYSTWTAMRTSPDSIYIYTICHCQMHGVHSTCTDVPLYTHVHVRSPHIHTQGESYLSYWSLNYKPQSIKDFTLHTEKTTPWQYHSNAPKLVYTKLGVDHLSYIHIIYTTNRVTNLLLGGNSGPYTYSYQIPGKVSVTTTSTCLMRLLSQLRASHIKATPAHPLPDMHSHSRAKPANRKTEVYQV